MENFGGDWTLQKLDILGKYLQAYTNALKDKNLDLVYIDAFAGSGECRFKPSNSTRGGFFPEYSDAETRNFHDGSAQIALKLDNPFDKYIFIP